MLPIQRIHMEHTRSHRYRELKFRLRVFSRHDIELMDADRYYLCAYCGFRLPSDYDVWKHIYRLCPFCERWYRHCFESRDAQWIARAYRNMRQRVRTAHYRKMGVQVHIEDDEFHFLAQTLLVSFRFYYPFERPSVDRYYAFQRSDKWPHYSWETIAIVPHSLNCILRSSCLTMEQLDGICRLLEQPSYHGQHRDIAKQFNTSDRCISDVANGVTFQSLQHYDARHLELFKDPPNRTPKPTMWNWEYDVNPYIFHEDQQEHDRQLAIVLRDDAFRYDD